MRNQQIIQTITAGRITKTETVARLVLTNQWNLVKTELNKKLKDYTYEEV